MSLPVTLELQAKIADWRLKAAEGTLSLDEMKAAILHLRSDRMAAARTSQTTAAKKKKAFATIPDAASMMDELEGL